MSQTHGTLKVLHQQIQPMFDRLKLGMDGSRQQGQQDLMT